MSTIKSKVTNGKQPKFESVESMEAENKALREENAKLSESIKKFEKLFIIDEEVEDNKISISEIKNMLLNSLPNNISVDIVWELSNELRAKINAEIFDSENSLALNKLALSKLK